LPTLYRHRRIATENVKRRLASLVRAPAEFINEFAREIGGTAYAILHRQLAIN